MAVSATKMIVGSALALVCAMVVLGMARVGHAQSPVDFLVAHNAERSKVGGLPVMEWSDTVAAYARSQAGQRAVDCNLAHSQGPYGENLLWSLGVEMNAADVVSTWVEEKKWYNYTENTCAQGKQCGHYTQVVWKNSVRLGCTRASCQDDAMLILCYYDPPGNILGERPF